MNNLERLVQKDPKMIATLITDSACVNFEKLELVYFKGECEKCEFANNGHSEKCYFRMINWLLEEVKE